MLVPESSGHMSMLSMGGTPGAEAPATGPLEGRTPARTPKVLNVMLVMVVVVVNAMKAVMRTPHVRMGKLTKAR